MRVIIPTRAHVARMHTHDLFRPEDVTFVVASQHDADQLPTRGHRSEVVITGLSTQLGGIHSVAQTRDWISQNLLEEGEWALLCDDNIRQLTCVADPFYRYERLSGLLYSKSSSEWREIFSHPVDDPMVLAEEIRSKCEEVGTIFGGLSGEDNYFYRTTKWSMYSYTKTKFAVWRNDRSLSWSPFDGCMFEDFVMTAQVVAKYGCVANNRFARMHNPYWEAGGIGSFEERRPHLERNVEWLLAKFPGLLKQYKDQRHAVTFAMHGRKQVDNWRRAHGYL